MEQEKIDIAGLDKAEVLAALYNGSRQLGMGFMHARGAAGMTVEEARVEVTKGDDNKRMFGPIGGREKELYFDYLHGRVIKSNIGGDSLDPWGYDRDNGRGAALRVLSPLILKRDAALVA